MKTIHKQFTKKGKVRQAGMTLIETLVALTIFALVVGGALALSRTASGSQSSTQFTSDLSALRASTKAVYFGQGGYGTASLNSVLINGNKVPATMPVSGTTINHSLNGTVTVTGATSQFTIALTNIPTDVCMDLEKMNGWDSVLVGSNPVRTGAVSPSTASSDCSAASNQTMTFTGS